MVTSSVAGKVGAPGASAYSATKHAVQGYYNALRMEVADRNVHVTMVCPGPVESEVGVGPLYCASRVALFLRCFFLGAAGETAPRSRQRTSHEHAPSCFFWCLRLTLTPQITMHAFTADGTKLGQPKDGSPRVTSQRCGFLMACALYHKLDEVWISLQVWHVECWCWSQLCFFAVHDCVFWSACVVGGRRRSSAQQFSTSWLLLSDAPPRVFARVSRAASCSRFWRSPTWPSTSPRGFCT
jgi:hypothetical protein